MITEIKKGDRFLCLRKEPGTRFVKGKIYRAILDGVLENDLEAVEIDINNSQQRDNFNKDFAAIWDEDTQQDLTREAIEQDEAEGVADEKINWSDEPAKPMTDIRDVVNAANAGKFTKEEMAVMLGLYENTPTPDVSITTGRIKPDSLESRQFDTGSKRDNDDNKPLPMEMNPYMLMRYGYHMKYGQVRYGDGNWELQQPDSEVWRSMSRHFTQAYMNFRFPEQAKATDDGTDHLSALLFGINMLMHNECSKGVEADMYFKRRNK